jgi:hypothetical protein
MSSGLHQSGHREWCQRQRGTGTCTSLITSSHDECVRALRPQRLHEAVERVGLVVLSDAKCAPSVHWLAVGAEQEIAIEVDPILWTAGQQA